MKKIVLGFFSAAVLAILSGCCTGQSAAIPAALVVKADPGQIVFDGRLDEKFWQQAPAHTLAVCDKYDKLPPLELNRIRQDKLEKCTVKFACDDKYFYAAANVEDNDMVAVTLPQAPAVINGDRLVIYLVPEKALHCWELASGPNAVKSAFFYQINGLYLNLKDKEKYGQFPGFDAMFKINGTLNKQNDRDKGWTSEIRIPLAEIARHGVDFSAGEKWRIAVYRTNYSAYNYAVQTSTFPQLPTLNMEFKKFFAPVVFCSADK